MGGSVAQTQFEELHLLLGIKQLPTAAPVSEAPGMQSQLVHGQLIKRGGTGGGGGGAG